MNSLMSSLLMFSMITRFNIPVFPSMVISWIAVSEILFTDLIFNFAHPSGTALKPGVPADRPRGLSASLVIIV